MLGPNGCGKSTLLRTLSGLQPSLSGGVQVAGVNPLLPENRSVLPRYLALVLTERVSLENTSVHDVVAMGRYPYTSFLGGLTEADELIIRHALEAVGFADSQQRSFNSLSDGEKQRVLIAKSLAQETPIILLDEPTAHLDLPNRIRVLQLLRQLAHDEQKTILISTHELDLAFRLSDRILLMTPARENKNGSIEIDTPARLRACDAFTRAFNIDVFNPL